MAASGGDTAPLVGAIQRSDRAHLLAPGTLVGEWSILGERGHGGFGTVYRARHVVTGALAAVKVLHPELAKHDGVLTRFDREVATVRALQHPNIVRTIGSGDLHDGRPYLVMDWLDGSDLLELVRARGPMTPAEVLRVLAQVTSALELVHAAGVVHRDIKPTNLIAVGDHVVLVDFGIAKLLEPTAVRTETGVRLGTPEAMAPEQITGAPIDARTDVYALGVLTYFLLTGRFPFVAEAGAEIERMQITAPRPRPSDRAPVSPAIDDVVLRAMSIDPAQRQRSAAGLFDELSRALDSVARPTGGVCAICIDVDGDVRDDATAIAVDDALLDVRDRLRADGLTIAVDTSNLLLALGPARERIDKLAAELAGFRIDGAVVLRVRVREGAPNELTDLDTW